VQKTKSKNVDEKLALNDFQELTSLSHLKNYEHYELSNFARKEKYAIHNTNYWKGAHYFGFGPAAHSFSQNKRRWNISNNPKYINAIFKKTVFYEEETLTQKEMFNEFIMIGLRTKWGINLNDLKNRFDASFVNMFLKDVELELQGGNIILDNGTYFISSNAKFISDRIISNLFVL